MAVKLSNAAQRDLFDIALDGLDKFGPRQAEIYETGLVKCLDTLDRNPRIGSEHDDYVPPVRMFPYQSHVVVYRIEDAGIFIIRICHAREDWTRAF